MWKSKNKLHKTSDLLKFLSLTKLINKYIISKNNVEKEVFLMKNLKRISIIILLMLSILTINSLATTGTVNAPNGLILRKEAAKSGEIIMTISDKIYKLRAALSMSQEQFANLFNVVTILFFNFPTSLSSLNVRAEGNNL